MIKLFDLELDFDMTSPTDVMRYRDARDKAEKLAEVITYPDNPDALGYLDNYVAALNAELKVFGDFVDDVFGDGVANKLLGSNPSLTKMLDVNDEMEKAIGQSGKDFDLKMRKYTPNRAARRANK